MTDDLDLTALPDPTDRAMAWHDGGPAYLAWWHALVDRDDVYHQIGTHRLIRNYGEAVPSIAALDALGELTPLLEVGAGAGYWARLLRDRGVDVLAVDPGHWSDEYGSLWTDVVKGDHLAVVDHPERTPFACWPPRPDGYATELVQLAPQRTLALLTVGPISLTGEPDRLWAALEHGRWRQARQVIHPTWPMKGDRLTIWRR